VRTIYTSLLFGDMDDTEDFYLYLSSRENLDLFNHNNAAGFTNVISPSRKLGGNFSVAVKNVIFEKDFHQQFLNHNKQHVIEFELSYYTVLNGDMYYTGNKRLMYFPPTFYVVKDPQLFITSVNSDLCKFVNDNIRSEIVNSELDKEELPPEINSIIKLNQESNFVEFGKISFPMRNISSGIYKNVECKWTFSRNLGKIFGLDDFSTMYPKPVTYIRIPPFVPKTILVYADFIEPSFLGSQMIHLLDILPMGETFFKTSDISMYKRVSKDFIDNISIRLISADGGPLPFTESVSTLIVLHFRLDTFK